MPKAGFIPDKLKPWIEARQRYRLSHAQVQMARELGMNPKKLGSIANYRQEPWKMPLPQFIEYCYEKQFRRKQPQDIRSIEEKEAEKRVRQNSSRGERPDVSDTKIGLIKPVQMRSSLSQEATLVQIVKEVEEQPIQMVDVAK